MPTPSTAPKRVLLGVLILAGTLPLARAGGFDARGAIVILTRTADGAWLAFVPFAALLLLEASAWALALGVAPRPAMLARLARGRLAIEAVSLTVPGSILVSDGIAPIVFGRSASVGTSTAVAAVALKKWGIILGHVVVLALAGIAGGAFFDALDRTRFALSPRLSITLACGFGLVTSLFLAGVLTHGAAERLRRTLGRLPLPFVRRLTARAVHGAAHTDAHARAFFDGPRSRVYGLGALSVLVWIAESVEVYVLLRILGATPPFTSVLAMESLLTIVRSIAFFSPGGLGAQELAYLTLLPPLLGDASVETASGFVVLRRLRDLVTIALGYVALATGIAREPGGSEEARPDFVTVPTKRSR